MYKNIVTYSNTGEIQMDASMIDGFKMECGSVAVLSHMEHPISLARYVLDNSPNSIIIGKGAEKLAKHVGLNWLSRHNMTAPMAYLAHKLEKTDDSGANWITENHQQAEILKSTS